ncbi:MAG: ABC transporter permease subunit [Streptosporangiales bacterium]|nr:ABC transporter permease subunit [Streptosporangiales bacterium]
MTNLGVAPVVRPPLYRRVWFQRTVTWGLLLVLWEWFGQQVGPFYFPTVGGTLDGLWSVTQDGSLLTVGRSFGHMFAGFGLAVVIGVPVGLLMGTSRIAEWMLSPYIKALFVTSLAALLPFVILLFGTGFEFRAAVVFLFSIFYIVITPANGVREIDRGLIEVTRSLSASRVKTFFSLVLPGSLPFIITGLRLGLGQAIQGVIIAEIWVTVGTGRKLVTLGLARELGEFFALAAVVVLIGAALTQLLIWAQRRFTPWAGDVEASLKGGE